MTKVEVWKYDAKNKKANYAKDKYNEDTKELLRLRSEKEALITDDKLVSFVGEVIPTPIKEKIGDKKNAI